MNLDLRPLTLGELFDRGFTLYRRNLWLFVGITAIPAVFALALALSTQMFQRYAITTRVDPDASPEAVFTVLWMVAGVFVIMTVYWVVYMIALGATTYAVSEIYVGRTSSIRESYAGIRGRIGALIVLMLLIGLRVGVLFIVAGATLAVAAVGAALIHPVLSGLLMIGGMLAVFALAGFMMLRYGMSVPALVVEGLSPGDAIRRSIALTKGRLGRVFLLVLCAMMVTYAAALIFQGPFAVASLMAGAGTTTAFWFDIAGAVTGTVATTFASPFMIIGLALLYYDARIREEGFDLELTIEALDARAGVARA